jgi:multiple sugar transport system permease protein
MNGVTSMQHSTRQGLTKGLRIFILASACAVALFPFFYMVSISVKPRQLFFVTPPTIIPSELTASHYQSVIGDPQTILMLKNSLIVAGCTTFLSVLLGGLAAYGLGRLGLRSWVLGFAVFIMLFIRFYPKITTAIPFFVIMRDLGLLDTPWAIVFGHLGITVPFATWLLLIFFEGVPREIEEAAIVDGATVARRLVHVVLPLAKPGITSAAIFTAFLSWNEFLIASTVTRQEGVVLSMGVASFITDKGILFGPMGAMASMIVAPMVIFALLMQKHFARGLTLGAVSD